MLIRFLLLGLLLLVPGTGWGARLGTSGFEENALATQSWSQTGNLDTVGSVSPHSGTYRLNTSAVAGNSYVTYPFTSHTSGTLYGRVYFQADDATPSADSVIFSNAGAQVSLLTTGLLRLTNVVTTTVANGAVTLSNATWYRIEVEHLLSDTVGTMTVRLYDDGNPATLLETIGPITGEDTLPASITGWRVGKTASTSTFSYDDFAVNDATGSFQTSWAGPGKIYLLVPDSNVSITWEDSAGGTNNATFANIDDLTGGGAINDADYNAADTALDAADAIGSIDKFGLTNLGAEITSDATITIIDVYARVGSTQTSATHLRFKLYDEAAALTDGPSTTANVNGFIYTTNSDVQRFPYNATGKTKANLDSFNIGYEVLTDTITARPRRVSALWVNVEWTEAAPAGGGLIQQNGGYLRVIIQ